jgi:hypothetical protein
MHMYMRTLSNNIVAVFGCRFNKDATARDVTPRALNSRYLPRNTKANTAVTYLCDVFKCWCLCLFVSVCVCALYAYIKKTGATHRQQKQHTHTYTQTYIHTYIHTYINTCAPRSKPYTQTDQRYAVHACVRVCLCVFMHTLRMQRKAVAFELAAKFSRQGENPVQPRLCNAKNAIFKRLKTGFSLRSRSSPASSNAISFTVSKETCAPPRKPNVHMYPSMLSICV